MRPDERDVAYLWDMLEAAKNIAEFTHGINLLQYMQDRKIQLAVERSLEIIGEAAKNVSDVFKQAHPDIAWRKIIGQRNVIAHEYGEIKQERIWDLTHGHIPDLIQKLSFLVPKTIN